MYENLRSFFAAAQPILDALDKWASAHEPAVIADHLCYKCGDREEFESLRRLFEDESAYIYQSVISNRRIAVIKFTRPLKTALGDIWFLELSDQKPDGSQESGFDHIEAYPIEGTVEDMVTVLRRRGLGFGRTVRPHHTTYDSSLGGKYKIRLEPERLVQKIKNDEMH